MKTTKEQRAALRPIGNHGTIHIAGEIVTIAALLDDLDEMERDRDEWKRSAERCAEERDHAIGRFKDAVDVAKKHAMAAANESANLRVASVIRELHDVIAALERRDVALTQQNNELADSLRALNIRWRNADGSIRTTAEMRADAMPRVVELEQQLAELREKADDAAMMQCEATAGRDPSE